MRWIGLAAAAISLAAAQDREAAGALREAERTMGRESGWRVHLGINAFNQQDAYDGTCADEVAYLTGPIEAYCRADRTAVNSGGRWQAARDLQGPEGARAASIKNPYGLLAEFLATRARAASNGEETLTLTGADGATTEVACLVIASTADERQTEAQVRDLLSRSGQASQYIDPSRAVDARASRSAYRAWIGREDHRVYKIEWTLEPRVNRDALGQGMPLPPGAEQYIDQMRADTTCEFSGFGEVEGVEMPREAQRALR